VTRATGWRALDGVVQRRSVLPADEVTTVNDIPVTSMPRTVLDFAAVSSRQQLENALNEVEVRRLTDKLSIPNLLERYPGRRGSAVLREILGEKARARGITRQELEERFVVLLDGTGLSPPRRNADVAVAGRFFEVDCLWARQRVIVELDGRAAHGTERAFEKDRERDRLLLADGWRVVRITWRQLHDDAPAVLADLRRLLRVPPQPPTL
jgi:very-short-patch-repair endonuclease